ncbi:phage holin family protein, partial [Clostridium sp.]
MENILNYFKFGVAAIGTWFTWLFGIWDIAIGILILFIVLDYLTGV